MSWNLIAFKLTTIRRVRWTCLCTANSAKEGLFGQNHEVNGGPGHLGLRPKKWVWQMVFFVGTKASSFRGKTKTIFALGLHFGLWASWRLHGH